MDALQQDGPGRICASRGGELAAARRVIGERGDFLTTRSDFIVG